MTATLGEAPVTGDGVLLERLVANLLDNASDTNIAGGTVAISDDRPQRDIRPARSQQRNGGLAGLVERLFLPFHPARRPHPPRRLGLGPRHRLIDRRGCNGGTR